MQNTRVDKCLVVQAFAFGMSGLAEVSNGVMITFGG